MSIFKFYFGLSIIRRDFSLILMFLYLKRAEIVKNKNIDINSQNRYQLIQF